MIQYKRLAAIFMKEITSVQIYEINTSICKYILLFEKINIASDFSYILDLQYLNT